MTRLQFVKEKIKLDESFIIEHMHPTAIEKYDTSKTNLENWSMEMTIEDFKHWGDLKQSNKLENNIIEIDLLQEVSLIEVTCKEDYDTPLFDSEGQIFDIDTFIEEEETAFIRFCSNDIIVLFKKPQAINWQDILILPTDDFNYYFHTTNISVKANNNIQAKDIKGTITNNATLTIKY